MGGRRPTGFTSAPTPRPRPAAACPPPPSATPAPAGRDREPVGNVSLDRPRSEHSGRGFVRGSRIALLDTNFNEVAFTFTDPNGNYHFDNLFAGTYTIFEQFDELGQELTDGTNYIGTVNGNTNGSIFSGDADMIQGIVLSDGDVGTGYNFTEIRLGT